jgi:serine/threonine-protein kinase
MVVGEGDTLGGYRISRLIGRGGMGAVYLADDLRLGRKVALKLLAPEMAEQPGVRERFVRESQAAAGLDHPHILPIYEAGQADGQLFIAMRYVPGPDLEGVIGRDGPLPVERTVALLDQVASALDAAHAAGLIHRDVKPGNILVAPGSTPRTDHAYLSDFGLTKHAEYGTALTRSGQLIGSVGYVAPEQVEGRPIDRLVDIYSLGCVLYECLAGVPPYRRDTEMATLYAHVHAPPPSLAEARPELSAALDPVIAKAMAKAPEERYGTALELAQALAGAARPDAAARHLTRGFLFADLRGYTAFVEAHGDDEAAQLLETYRRLVREVVRRYGGAEIRTEGDSLYVVFPSASDAVRCGLAIVAAAASATDDRPERPIAVGVGVHAGETAETAEGYVGSAVNIAARLCAQAAAGEVLVSDTVRGLVRTSGEVAFTARGRRHLKGIAEPLPVYAAGLPTTPAMGAAAPPRGRGAGALGGRRVARGRQPLAIAAGIIAIVLLGGLGLTALGSFGSAAGLTGRPSLSPSSAAGRGGPSISASGSASTTSTAAADEPGSMPFGPIAPGRYRIEGVQGIPIVTMPGGWQSDPCGCVSPRMLYLQSRPTTRLTILDPGTLPADACGTKGTSANGTGVAQRWVDWFVHDPALKVSQAVLRVFGSTSATQFDVSVVPAKACRTSDPASVALYLWNPGAVAFSIAQDRRARVYIFDTQPRAVMAVFEGPSEDEFQLSLPQVETILESLGWPAQS